MWVSVLSAAWPCSFPSHSQYLAPFWHICTFLYRRTSSCFSSHTLIIVDPSEAKLGNSHILPVSREWVNGNTTVTCKWGFFFLTYFRCVRNAFVADVILLVGRRGPCFINVISFHPVFFFWGSTCFDGCGSSCWIPGMFFLGRIRRKGGGGTNSSLNSFVKTFISSIRCFCWSVSSELLSLSFRLTFSLFSF